MHEECYTQYWYVRIFVVFGLKYTDPAVMWADVKDKE